MKAGARTRYDDRFLFRLLLDGAVDIPSRRSRWRSEISRVRNSGFFSGIKHHASPA